MLFTLWYVSAGCFVNYRWPGKWWWLAENSQLRTMQASQRGIDGWHTTDAQTGYETMDQCTNQWQLGGMANWYSPTLSGPSARDSSQLPLPIRIQWMLYYLTTGHSFRKYWYDFVFKIWCAVGGADFDCASFLRIKDLWLWNVSKIASLI